MMKSIIWFHILVLCFSFIYCTDQTSGVYEEFGCQFENNRYDKRVDGFFDIAYSDTPIDGMEFTDAATFEILIRSINRMNEYIANNFPFNSLGALAIFYKNFRIQPRNLKTFYKTYRPRYIRYNSSPGFTVELLKLITDYMPDTAPHVYLATAYLNVTERYIKEIVNHELPPRFFLHNHVAGVMKIKYFGRSGYIIMDPTLGLSDPVIIMKDGKPPHKDNVDGTTRHFNSERFTFSLKKNNYLEAKTVLNQNGRPHENHLYFLGKRFCSILETTLKNSLISPERIITIRDEEADFVSTMKMTFISTMRKCEFISFKDRLIRLVQNINLNKFKLTKTNKEVLQRFSNLCDMDKYQFRDTIYQAKSMYYYPSFIDYFYKLFKINDEIVNKLRITYAPGENPEEKTNASITDISAEDMLYKLKSPTMIVNLETAALYKPPANIVIKVATKVWSRGETEHKLLEGEYDYY